MLRSAACRERRRSSAVGNAEDETAIVDAQVPPAFERREAGMRLLYGFLDARRLHGGGPLGSSIETPRLKKRGGEAGVVAAKGLGDRFLTRCREIQPRGDAVGGVSKTSVMVRREKAVDGRIERRAVPPIEKTCHRFEDQLPACVGERQAERPQRTTARPVGAER